MRTSKTESFVAAGRHFAPQNVLRVRSDNEKPVAIVQDDCHRLNLPLDQSSRITQLHAGCRNYQTVVLPQQFLDLRPLPQGQASFRPTLGNSRREGISSWGAWPKSRSSVRRESRFVGTPREPWSEPPFFPLEGVSGEAGAGGAAGR